MLRVAPLSIRPRGTLRPFYIAPERAELLKWAGLAAMLTDHIGLYVFGRQATEGLSYEIGRLAFPLFVMAIAAGLAAPGARLVVVWRRLVAWAVVAQLASLPVRELLPFNVLLTFALGLGLVGAVTMEAHRYARIGAVVGLLFAAGYVEFVHPGVLMVAAAVWYARAPSGAALGALLAATAGVCVINGNTVALGALGLAWLLGTVPLEVRRVRRLFYVAYVGQFPLLWLARGLV